MSEARPHARRWAWLLPMAALAGCPAQPVALAPEAPAVVGRPAPGLDLGPPTRTLSLDRFALEAAVGSLLAEARGGDGPDSTTWVLEGEGVAVTVEAWRWGSAAEAELRCQASAGPDAARSLERGEPAWATARGLYLARGPGCVRIAVVRRGSELDQAAAWAVAAPPVGLGVD